MLHLGLNQRLPADACALRLKLRLKSLLVIHAQLWMRVICLQQTGFATYEHVVILLHAKGFGTLTADVSRLHELMHPHPVNLCQDLPVWMHVRPSMKHS